MGLIAVISLDIFLPNINDMNVGEGIPIGNSSKVIWRGICVIDRIFNQLVKGYNVIIDS